MKNHEDRSYTKSTIFAQAVADKISPVPELIDLNGVATILNISERTVRRYDSSGRIPRAIKIGGCKRWRIAELLAWIDADAPPRQKWESLRERT